MCVPQKKKLKEKGIKKNGKQWNRKKEIKILSGHKNEILKKTHFTIVWGVLHKPE